MQAHFPTKTGNYKQTNTHTHIHSHYKYCSPLTLTLTKILLYVTLQNVPTSESGHTHLHTHVSHIRTSYEYPPRGACRPVWLHKVLCFDYSWLQSYETASMCANTKRKKKPSWWHAVSESVFSIFSYTKGEPLEKQEVLESHAICLFKLVIPLQRCGSLPWKTSSSLIARGFEWGRRDKIIGKNL